MPQSAMGCLLSTVSEYGGEKESDTKKEEESEKRECGIKEKANLYSNMPARCACVGLNGRLVAARATDRVGSSATAETMMA